MHRPIQRKADLIEELIASAQTIARLGYVPPGRGSMSARLPGRAAMTLTGEGVRFDRIGYDALVTVDTEGNVIEGEVPPTKDMGIHLAVYKGAPHVVSLLVAHPPYATMFALAGRPLPAVVADLAEATGGSVSFVDTADPRADPGPLVANLAETPVLLVRNLGVVATGSDPDEALERLIATEHAAHVVWGALMLARGIGGRFD
ncbi:MAG: L-ribulose-5-phosphate 4-epimerase [Acidimicrobiales bacterium]|nr:MAG: L-ribulose-5-phosphate 4-epimerase [Acidimicrobiales bacterium]